MPAWDAAAQHCSTDRFLGAYVDWTSTETSNAHVADSGRLVKLARCYWLLGSGYV
jgi:hypothetical protein